jgi:hypothetical protein
MISLKFIVFNFLDLSLYNSFNILSYIAYTVICWSSFGRRFFLIWRHMTRERERPWEHSSTDESQSSQPANLFPS